VGIGTWNKNLPNANLAFLKPDFEILAFLTHLAFLNFFDFMKINFSVGKA